MYDIPRDHEHAGVFEGYWERAPDAHGNKRNVGDWERWRSLARIGVQSERVVLSEQADVLEDFGGLASSRLLI